MMTNTDRLVRVGIVPEQAKVLVEELGAPSADKVTVGPITAANVSFAGGTLTAALQAIADAIPAA